MLSCAWEGVKKVSVGQLGACGAGVRCSLVLHRGGGGEYKEPLCVWQEKRVIVHVCYFYKLLCNTHV